MAPETFLCHLPKGSGKSREVVEAECGLTPLYSCNHHVQCAVSS